MNFYAVETGEPIYVAVDFSSIRVLNLGNWMRNAWKINKCYLKIHLAVDARSRVRQTC